MVFHINLIMIRESIFNKEIKNSINEGNKFLKAVKKGPRITFTDQIPAMQTLQGITGYLKLFEKGFFFF